MMIIVNRTRQKFFFLQVRGKFYKPIMLNIQKRFLLNSTLKKLWLRQGEQQALKTEIMVYFFIYNGNAYLGFIYTKRQRKHSDNSTMTLAILLSLKTMESLQNGVTTHFQVTPLLSLRTESLASPQSWC